REAASERKVLHDIAPHLAQPSWFILPSRKPQETALLKTALTAFEALGGVAKADRHKALTPARLSELEPLMRSERLHRGLMYREYLTDDARLT
ncbi:glycerol-3-phosphate dehydrogenase, partial [Pseudomonas sp. GW247-3R2A]